MNGSVLTWYKRFLNMSDKFLMHAVDVYNYGGMSKNARLALEAIDGCVGPGDAIVEKDIRAGGF